MFIPPGEFIGMIMAIGIGHPCQPSGNVSVIEPSHKIFAVCASEATQGKAVIYQYRHVATMNGLTDRTKSQRNDMAG